MEKTKTSLQPKNKPLSAALWARCLKRWPACFGRRRGSKHSAQARSQAGFTLLELLLVVALLVMVGTAVVPKFSKIFRVSVQSSVRRFAALVRFAYDESVLTGRIHRIVLNLDDQSWTIEAAQPGMLPIDKAKVGLLTDHMREEERVLNEPEFKKAGGDFVVKIPNGVTLVSAQSWRLGKDGASTTKGQVSIYAFPNGFMDEATVTLAESGKEKQQRFKVTTNSLTGRVRIETETDETP